MRVMGYESQVAKYKAITYSFLLNVSLELLQSSAFGLCKSTA